MYSVIKKTILLVAAAVCILSLRAPADDTYRFSVNPWGTEDEMRAMFHPLLDHIESETGARFEFVFFPTYDDVLVELSNGYVHFAVTNAVGFLKLRRMNAPITYLVSSVRSFGEFERDYYLGYIITQKGSKIEDFEDLRGKVFGFVEESSGSGYKMPRAMLGLMGETPDSFFKKYFFLGDHDEVAKAVKNGCVDAGATWEASYMINTRKFGDIFKIVKETPPIPNDAWLVRDELPDSLKENIRKTLLETTTDTINSKGALVLDQSLGLPETGFIEKSPEFYEKAAPLLLYGENTD